MQKSEIICISYNLAIEVSHILTKNPVNPLLLYGSNISLVSGLSIGTFTTLYGILWISQICANLCPKLPPSTINTKSLLVKEFITAASIAPVPDAVRNTTFELSSAYVSSFIIFSFSSIIFEND